MKKNGQKQKRKYEFILALVEKIGTIISKFKCNCACCNSKCDKTVNKNLNDI
tara:strand:- start:667 stop:822 length:156 start_codon:yes stop_codon:yes gene_type:complete